jgi:hypothetical protein
MTRCVPLKKPFGLPRSTLWWAAQSASEKHAVRKLFSVLALLAFATLAGAGLSSSDLLSLDDEAIQYTSGPVDDPVDALQHRIDKGEVKLNYEGSLGYLRSVLEALHISATSQVLVFSKTSFQAPRISPRMPRALYFRDNAAIGFVRTGDVLEVAALDVKQGLHFYTLNQEPTAHPQFERRDICLQCHQAGATMGIPGLMVRSVFPDSNGMPITRAGGFITDHRSPLKERWGGWYVTGTTGNQVHMGNAVMPGATGESMPPVEGSQNVTDLKPFLDTGAYLTPHSDIIALMTLEHQTQMENLMIRVGWETRIAMTQNRAMNRAFHEPEEQIRDSTAHRIDAAVEELLAYMFFNGETALTSPVKGTSGFAEEFQKLGPRDSKGRSLRDFDLKTRMFRYPCSFLIYTEAFDGMPQVVKDRLYRRMWAVLSMRDNSPGFAHLTASDRKAIREILLDTKKDLPAYWRASRASSRSQWIRRRIQRTN